MTRTLTITGRAGSRPSLILPYPQHFRVLPTVVSTPTSFCLHRQHTALLTSVCEDPESTRAKHSRLSTSTFTTGNSFSLSWEVGWCWRLLPLVFPWHSDEMCPILLHRKHCCSRLNFHATSDPSSRTVFHHMVRPKQRQALLWLWKVSHYPIQIPDHCICDTSPLDIPVHELIYSESTEHCTQFTFWVRCRITNGT